MGMQIITHALSGTECAISVVESDDDARDFGAWLDGQTVHKPIALDTETSGLDTFSAGHELRLVQFGTTHEAFVLPAERFSGAITRALATGRTFVAHNAPYDLLVLDRHGVARLEDLQPRTYDTRILAHLIDPRGKEEGGIGLGLKDLSRIYVDPSATDTERELVALFRSMKLTKATGYARVPIDNETYLRYAGLDVLLTARLFDEITPRVLGMGLGYLSDFEHAVSGCMAQMTRRGVLLDVDYTQSLSAELDEEAEKFSAVARRYGVESVNSPTQVAQALAAMGETLSEHTPSGAPKVDKAVLLSLADLDTSWRPIESRKPNPLADAIMRSKRAGKWRTTYAEACLAGRDPADRVHATINSLQARTARMSISNPPLQQLPSSDWRVRRCFIADPGQLIIAADYSQVEMRILAALSGDETMIAAIQSGQDLHDFTASRVYGPDFTKAQRKIAKGVGFGKVYGGGATGIARQTGAPVAAVKAAIDAYDETYPGVKKYARRLMRQAEYGKAEVVTVSGRRLPLDRDRLYAATNFVVQSTARDVLAQSVLDLFAAGLGDYLLLAVHDELVAQAPAADAADIVSEIGRVMSIADFGGVPITTDSSVSTRSWGGLYGCPPDKDLL